MTDNRPRSSSWPYALLAAMTLVSFGGPFLVLVVVWGGKSPNWPPDRLLEWITIAVVLGLFVVLFFACTTMGSWYRPLRRKKASPGTATGPDRPISRSAP
jgi:hypothetical protein